MPLKIHLCTNMKLEHPKVAVELLCLDKATEKILHI